MIECKGMKPGDKLELLRKKMKVEKLEAYICYAKDPHQSECVADHWNDRKWLSGFSGSAGVLLVTCDAAALWTDGRYATQARAELQGLDVELHITGLAGSKKLPDLIKELLPPPARVGMNGNVVSLKEFRSIDSELTGSGIELVPADDILCGLWEDRPVIPNEPVWLYPLEYAGESRKDKINRLRNRMSERGIDRYALCALDALAWLFNIRGSDVEHTPIATAFALVSRTESTLFIDADKVACEVCTELEDDGVTLRPYSEFQVAIEATPAVISLGFDPGQMSKAIADTVPEKCSVVELNCPVNELKCIKNPIEIGKLEKVMEKDAVAFCRFLYWLEQSMAAGVVTEVDADHKLEALRREQEGLIDLSFPAIVGYGPHAALPHYQVSDASNLELDRNGLFLIDSGGNYLGGTTDLTRTLAMGELTDEMKRDYTLVLKGLINISRTAFLSGCSGSNLDILARMDMWQHGIDYKHGTGHGVGSFLNVHEGPCGLSRSNRTSLRPGMVLTIEPGIYREGLYGIRLENIVVVEDAFATDSGKFLQFRTMTIAPIDTRPIAIELLAQAEIEWLNKYHREVFERLSTLMLAAELEWLSEKTAPI